MRRVGESAQPSADWCVVLEKPHSDLTEAVIQRLNEAFSLSHEAAEQVAAIGPTVLLDGLPKETAQALRDYFRNTGVRVVATNRLKIKNKCYRVSWEERPSLDFLQKGLNQESPTQPSTEWIRHLRDDFRSRLERAQFSVPKRKGARGPEFGYPEWLILFIAFLSVKLKIKSYLAVHQMTKEYWEILAEGLDLTPISERQLRDRLKKIGHTPKEPAGFISQLFPDNAP